MRTRKELRKWQGLKIPKWLRPRKSALVLVLFSVVYIGFSIFRFLNTPPKTVFVVHSRILSQYFYALDFGQVHERGITPNPTVVEETASLSQFATIYENTNSAEPAKRPTLVLVELPTPYAGRIREKNVNLRIVGTLIRPKGTDAVVAVRYNSEIVTLSDLRGRRVAVDDMYSTPVIMTRELLRGSGIAYDQVTYVRLPRERLLPSLENGEVDAAILYSGYASLARIRKDKYRIISYIFDDSRVILGGELPVAAVLVTNSSGIEQKCSVLKKSLVLVQKSFRYGTEHADEVVQKVAPALDLSPDVYKITFQTIEPTRVFLSPSDRKNILTLLNMAYKQGAIPAKVTDEIFFDVQECR